jgi:hypothetical protein
MIQILRETTAFKIERSIKGVRVTTKEKGATPKSRILPLRDWDQYLKDLPDNSFNAACVFDFGVGVFRQSRR